MYKGHIDVSFINNEMLAKIKFAEHNHVPWCGGLWDELGVPIPDFPYDGPWVYQSFEHACPAWAHSVKRLFDNTIKFPSVAVNLVKPGRYIPPHKDLFYRLLETAPKDVIEFDLEPVRINIFLQDWQIGHIFEMDGETWMGYKKGDYTVIRKGVPHSVVNIGYQPRYTMQISGFAEKGSFT